MEQNLQQQFRCSGDCMLCHQLQRQYCAAQFSYNSMRMIEDMQKFLSMLHGTVEELKMKIDAIQDNEASIFNPATQSGEYAAHPTEEVATLLPHAETIAQSGDGAE